MLLNVAGGPRTAPPGGGASPAVFGIPGDEAIPPSFRPVNLPTYLQQVRSYLFGRNPDQAMLNYRARQLLTAIEATELRQFITDLDPRLTYNYGPGADAVLFSDAPFTPTVAQVSGPATPLTVIGTPTEPDFFGQSQYSYTITILGAPVQVVRETSPRQSQIFDLVLSAGLSAPIPLSGTGYSVVVGAGDAGTAWHVSGFLRPQWELGDIAAALEQLGEPTLIALFGTAKTEPFQTFQNLWMTHPELPYRLGGLVLAVVYRTHQIWSAGG